MYQVKYQGGAEIQVCGNRCRVVNKNGVVVIDWTTWEECEAYCRQVYGRQRS